MVSEVWRTRLTEQRSGLLSNQWWAYDLWKEVMKWLPKLFCHLFLSSENHPNFFYQLFSFPHGPRNYFPSPLFLNHVLTTNWIAACSSVLSIRSFTSHSPPTACSIQDLLKPTTHIHPEDGSVCWNVGKPTAFNMTQPWKQKLQTELQPQKSEEKNCMMLPVCM